MRISDWSSDVCSSDLLVAAIAQHQGLTTTYEDIDAAVILHHRIDPDHAGQLLEQAIAFVEQIRRRLVARRTCRRDLNLRIERCDRATQRVELADTVADPPVPIGKIDRASGRERVCR